MKLKLNNIILLLGIIVFACILFLITINREGYTGQEYTNKKNDTFTSLNNDEVPGCDSNDSRVPACYSTVQTNYNDFTSDFLKTDDYVLKTQIVTPVCPSNPYTPFGSDISDNSNSIKNIYDLSFVDMYNFLKSQSTKDSSNNLVRNDGSFNIFNNVTNTTYKTENISPGAEPKVDQSAISNWLLSNPHTNNANNTPSQDSKYKNETPEAVSNISNIKSQPSTIEESNSSCPPCPACQRCPDPIVECKRVINYKNPNAYSNVPVPIIDDFSNFTK